jgi:hypothetical protein
MYTLFLDDARNPTDVTWLAIPFVGETVVARTYQEFVDTVMHRGIPAHVSFDHDLADFDVNGKELTGYHCAKWLVNHCVSQESLYPSHTVHSMNCIGKLYIDDYVRWAREHLDI